ncbi:MAG: DNA polymerase/3'-5' exonuclease PolX [Candidatus Harrisonbacteria bacterium]|nr:DNA polymerase/3'-5' exonuclease PolX [Candidatus Harrisonbacteria bacterium]
MTNQEIAKILGEIGIYLEMQDVPFKPRAYEKVAEVVANLNEEVKEIYKKGGLKALEEIPGVGVSIAEKIEEAIKTGKVKFHEQLSKKIPIRLKDFQGIQGLGPKTLKTLYAKLGIRGLRDLEKALASGRIRNLKGFGVKSEENILKSLEFLRKSGGRFVLGLVMPQIREIEARLKKLPGVKKIAVAGSVRRRKDTIGDADILITIDESLPASAPPSRKASDGQSKATAGKIMDYFVSMPEVARVFAHGETKSAVKLKNGLDMDLRVLPEESYGSGLNYFTGSKDHNVELRRMAIDKGYKLSEYGLFKGKKQIAGRSEEDLYKALGLAYIEPELREMTGEIEASRVEKLPNLVGYGDLKGDLQIQTNWTDGANSIEEMAEAALDAGLEYIAITDHTKRLAMTNGLDEKRIQKQWLEIDKVNKKFRVSGIKFRVLRGTECDILKDGSMDLPDEILAKCEVVGASVHSLFNLPKKEQTERIKRAMSNPHVDIIFHPTGRILNKRQPYDVDMEELIRHAKKTGTILEINASDRADLKDEYIRKCVEQGVKMAINSDSHSVSHFEWLEYGIAQARRGWGEKKDIINAWPLEKMLKMLK